MNTKLREAFVRLHTTRILDNLAQEVEPPLISMTYLFLACTLHFMCLATERKGSEQGVFFGFGLLDHAQVRRLQGAQERTDEPDDIRAQSHGRRTLCHPA
jgi:hypothetical protein